MADISSHAMLRLGLAAFIFGGILFIVLVPSLLIQALTVAGSVSLLLLLWIFIWVAMILAAGITIASKETRRAPIQLQMTAPAPQLRPTRRAAKRRKKR